MVKRATNTAPDQQPSFGQPTTAKDEWKSQNSADPSGANFTVSILADTSRDGKVGLTGDTDTVGKETWTDDVGALFLANIVDTDRRCSSNITGSCASELGAIFNETLPPETPVLDPRLPDLPKDGSMEQWFDSLHEIQRNLYYDFLFFNEKVEYEENKSSSRIADNIEILKRETGLTDADIIRLPGSYQLQVDDWNVKDPWKYAKNADGTNQISRRGVSNEIPSVLEAGTPRSQLRHGRQDSKGAGSPERWPIAALYPGTISSVVMDKKANHCHEPVAAHH
ncbi:hypothetical protein MY11210_002281 [Beauveria gryllotalpidicola]